MTHKNSRMWQMLEPIRYSLDIITGALRWTLSIFSKKVLQLLSYKNARKIQSFLRKHSPSLEATITKRLRLVVNYLTRKSIGYFSGDNEINVIHAPYNHSVFRVDLYSEKKYMPRVTVVVPNYNHEKYLHKRLDSIYNQTYKNIEVIILDDSSVDNSRDIIDEYYNAHSDITKVIYNDENSGSVFYQWKKGIESATGDLVWIAESDGWCDYNFLEQLVRFFKDESVMLAYSRTNFVDSDTNNRVWSMEDYLGDIDNEFWSKPFVVSAHNIVNNFFGIRNIIPNASSVVFRKPHDLDLFGDRQWLNLKFARDWIFYLAVIRGGCIAYTTKTTNYFRQHGVNTSTLIQNDEKYYREHEIVSKYLYQFYRIDDFVLERQFASLQKHYARTHKGALPKSLYNIKKIKQASSDRKLNLIMASFSFAAGGGETFPIVLANIMKSKGYAVTFFNFNRDNVELGVRKMLRSDIPVVSDLHKLNKIVHDFGAEIIHSHHAWVDSTILDGMSEGFTCRHIISCHGMYEDLDENRADELLPKMLEKCAKIVYTADKNLIPFKKRGLENHEKLTKIGNGLCLSDINPVDLSSYGISEDSFVLCLVSRAIPSKGWQEAIESVKIARATSKRDIQLIIIGDGEEGYAVTFFNFNRDNVELGVRKMLRSDIPVVSDLHKLNKIVHDFGAEIIHSHHAWVDSTILDGMSEGFTCRHIISCHGMYEDLDENRADELLPKMLEKCAKIVYTADKNLIPFKKRGLENHEKLTKIGNGLCLSDINPVDLSSYGISEDSFVLCLVSRAIPSKGWQEAIESVKIARATSKRDIQLIIIGDGEEYDRLKDIGLSYVHFLGFIPNIRDYYAASDMGYLPSRFRSESYPLTVIDCLFAGRPMLASNIGEISNMLHNGEKCSGVLFDLGSDWNIPVAKVAKLISICANDQDYYNELLENVKHNTDKFGPDALYENYNKVYMSQI